MSKYIEVTARWLVPAIEPIDEQIKSLETGNSDFITDDDYYSDGEIEIKVIEL